METDPLNTLNPSQNYEAIVQASPPEPAPQEVAMSAEELSKQAARQRRIDAAIISRAAMGQI